MAAGAVVRATCIERSAMAVFTRDALNPGVKPREVWGWALYDFANSGYTTVVLTAVFSAYFVAGVAGKGLKGGEDAEHAINNAFQSGAN